MRSDYRYHITYSLSHRPEGITAGEVPDGHGACDAVIICSMLYPADGSFSLGIFGGDGRTDSPVSSKDKFKVWAMWASKLATDPELSEDRRELCALAWGAFCSAINGTAKETP